MSFQICTIGISYKTLCTEPITLFLNRTKELSSYIAKKVNQNLSVAVFSETWFYHYWILQCYSCYDSKIYFQSMHFRILKIDRKESFESRYSSSVLKTG